jgi:hypothetical protein
VPNTSLDNKTDAELIALYGEVMSALLHRGVVRSGNNPIADMAERIVADYYDYVAIIVFAADMRLEEAAFVPLAAVREHMRWSKTWKCNRLSLTQKLPRDERVERIPADALLAATRRRTR